MTRFGWTDELYRVWEVQKQIETQDLNIFGSQIHLGTPLYISRVRAGNNDKYNNKDKGKPKSPRNSNNKYCQIKNRNKKNKELDQKFIWKITIATRKLRIEKMTSWLKSQKTLSFHSIKALPRALLRSPNELLPTFLIMSGPYFFIIFLPLFIIFCFYFSYNSK